jgi:hypothetical protein
VSSATSLGGVLVAVAVALVVAILPGESAVSGRAAVVQPFSASSPWNTSIGSGARYSAADAPTTREITDPDLGAEINSRVWSHPVYRASATDAVQEVRADSGEVWHYRMPPDAEPAIGDDAHLHVLDPSGRYAYETWRMRRTGPSTWRAGAVGKVDLYGDGISGGTRAYGGSAIAGLIRRPEIDQRSIPHALAVALPRADLRCGPVWPATLEDSGADHSYRGQVPLGALVAVPADVDLDALRLDPDALALAHALQDYGGYVVDSSAQFTLYAEPGADETRLDRDRAALDVIRRTLRVVENNSADHVSGGGARRRPAAPPLIRVRTNP